jgi:tripartite-type tricarboxylate transporter receptor subunit TctC
MVFNNKSTLLTHFKAGQLRALAVTSQARWPELPDIPTMQELGITGFPTEVWFGVLAPAGTPPAIVSTINTAVNEGLKSAEVRASLAALGLEAKVGSPQDFAAALTEQARDWKTVIDTIGFKTE